MALLCRIPSPCSWVVILFEATVLSRERKIRTEALVLDRETSQLLVCQKLFVEQPLCHGLQTLLRCLRELDLKFSLELLFQILEVCLSLPQAVVHIRNRCG